MKIELKANFFGTGVMNYGSVAVDTQDYSSVPVIYF